MRSVRFLIMSLLLLAGMVATGLVGPNRTAIEGEYQLSHTGFGGGLAVIQVTIASVVLLSAGKLRRIHPMGLLMVSVMVQCSGFLTIWQTRSLPALVGGWAMIHSGLMLGAICNNISMDLWPRNPSRGVVLLHGFNALGKVLGPLLAAAFVAVNWRLSFAASGGIYLCFAIIAGLLIARGAGRCLAPRSGSHHRPALLVLREKLYWQVVISFGAIAGSEAAFATLAPVYFQQEVPGIDARLAGVLLTVHLLGLAGGRFLAAWVSGRWSSRAIILVCLASGVMVFPAILVDNLAIRCVSLAVMGVMFSSTWPSFYAQVARPMRSHREMLAYGSGLGTAAGVSLCLLASSLIADWNLTVSVFFGPVVMWLFGVAFLASPLSRDDCPVI